MSNILRVVCLSGASMWLVLYCGFNVEYTAKSQYSFIVNRYVIVSAQNISYGTITFFRAFFMNLFNDYG